MSDVLTLIFLITGAAFMLVAAIGILRMPDVYMRMAATTKATTLGSMLILIGVSVAFNDFSITARAIAIVVFLFLTAPVASHLLGRVAYVLRVPLWDKTTADEWGGSTEHKHPPSPQRPRARRKRTAKRK